MASSKKLAIVPKGWPPGAVYLQSPVYSTKLSLEKIKKLKLCKSHLPVSTELYQLAGPYANVRIAVVSETTHPAHGQHALHATQHLPPDTLILPYLGFVHDQTDTDPTSDYDLSLDRDMGVGVDASHMGNEARFINDYRGVSTGANAEFRDIFVDVGNGVIEKRVGVFVLTAGKSGKRSKGIGRGQEILVSYGKGFWMERQSVAEQLPEEF